jgi:hypothetical protein
VNSGGGRVEAGRAGMALDRPVPRWSKAMTSATSRRAMKIGKRGPVAAPVASAARSAGQVDDRRTRLGRRRGEPDIAQPDLPRAGIAAILRDLEEAPLGVGLLAAPALEAEGAGLRRRRRLGGGLGEGQGGKGEAGGGEQGAAIERCVGHADS